MKINSKKENFIFADIFGQIQIICGQMSIVYPQHVWHCPASEMAVFVQKRPNRTETVVID